MHMHHAPPIFLLACCLFGNLALGSDDVAGRRAEAQKLYDAVISPAEVQDKLQTIADAVMEKFKNAPGPARDEGRKMLDERLAATMNSFRDFFVEHYAERFTEHELLQLTVFVKLTHTTAVQRFTSELPEFQKAIYRFWKERTKQLTAELRKEAEILIEKYMEKPNKSPEATPGQRLPAAPSPSPGAPHL